MYVNKRVKRGPYDGDDGNVTMITMKGEEQRIALSIEIS